MKREKKNLEDKFWATVKEADFILNEYSSIFGLPKYWELEKLIKSFIKLQTEKTKCNLDLEPASWKYEKNPAYRQFNSTSNLTK